jgi:hypothetical protein
MDRPNWPLPDGFPAEKTEDQTLDREKEYSESMVIGTAQLYEDGQLRLIPMPSPDPKDPLNLPRWRKWMALTSIAICEILFQPSFPTPAFQTC